MALSHFSLLSSRGIRLLPLRILLSNRPPLHFLVTLIRTFVACANSLSTFSPALGRPRISQVLFGYKLTARTRLFLA